MRGLIRATVGLIRYCGYGLVDAMGIRQDGHTRNVFYSLASHGLAAGFSLQVVLNRDGHRKPDRVPTQFDIEIRDHGASVELGLVADG